TTAPLLMAKSVSGPNPVPKLGQTPDGTSGLGADSLTAPAPVDRASESMLPSAPTEAQLQAGERLRFAALRHRNFRLFWMGNVISLVGTLAQQTAQGWLVRTLTHDPFLISAVAACSSLPILLLTLYAGVVADRIDRRRAL